MDDVASFGPVLHTLTFGEAIERDLLTDYQVVIVGVDEPMVKQWIDEQEIVALGSDQATDARSLAARVGLIKAIRDYDLVRVISFHSRVKGARDFSRELSEIVALVEEDHRPDGSIWTDYVSGEMSAGDRTTRIRKLKQLGPHDRGLLTNARCLSEGIDVPALDGVAFIDPKGSQVDIIQAVGRAIRKSESKEKGTIVIPVFIEEGDDVEASIEASNFKPVWDVLKALRSHDEVLANELDQYRTNMATGLGVASTGFSDKIIFDLPIEIDARFSGALRTVLVEATTASWNFWFGLLQDYVEREGHASVPAEHATPEGCKLGRWINKQRSRRDELTPERRARLEAVKGWIWDALEAQWEEGFQALDDYVDREGHAKVPVSHVTPEGYKLGHWAGAQRTRKDKMTPERRARLEALEGWVWDPFDAQWEEGFRALSDYVDREGHARVPASHVTPEGHKLGQWINAQRSKKDKLSAERRVRLEALDGWVWDLREWQWEEGYRSLTEYVDREGHARIPSSYVTPERYKLGQWAGAQRTAKDKMSPERRARLEALEGWVWDILEAQWEERFQALSDYVDREGHARIPNDYVAPGGSKLRRWVTAQRAAKEQMPRERRARLEALEGWVWDILEWQWEEGYRALSDYVDREGHARVPQSYVTPEGYKLGSWIANQRATKDKLTAERRARLEALKGWVWNRVEAQWEEGFQALSDYVNREGHARVPSSYVTPERYKLGLWVSGQRTRKDKMTAERRARLEAMKGWVWSAQKRNS